HHIVATPDLARMFSAVGRHEAHACLAPMENSLVGSIFESYDLLLQFGFRILGEVYLRVEHCLIAPLGTYLEDVERVYSHPITLDQCRTFFQRHPKLHAIATYDTAGSVRMLIRKREANAAAIAGRGAATHYGAKVLAENLEDDPANYTRFFLLTLQDAELDGIEKRFAPDQVGPTKTSVVFYVANAPGSLYDALGEFASRGLDLTRIESRPVRGKPFEYLFYLDFLGSPDEPPGQEALAGLIRRAGFARVLGTYPSGRLDWVGSDAPLMPRLPELEPPIPPPPPKSIDRKGPGEGRRS
ncbi:MAG TPA: prephenate dehydratase domain-containing protein, partial [Gemmatimonadota bacterium]|nr:prephenate dehydratase domain-containing protein [Gemmatimonadota bacterium]